MFANTKYLSTKIAEEAR